MDLKQKPKVVWISANKLGYELLKKAVAVKEVSVAAIITLDSVSKTKMYDGIPADKWAEFGIPIFKFSNINEGEEVIRGISPDFIFICGWRQMLGESLLMIPTKGAIGFHPTLLPKGRGPAPIINSILNGFSESGITMFYLTSKVDSGDIIGQGKFIIEKDDTAELVYGKVTKCGQDLIDKYLPLLARDKAPRIPQIEGEAIYFEPRKLKDNEIFAADSVEQAYAKIRALSWPYKGAYIRRNGKKIIIWKAELHDDENL